MIVNMSDGLHEALLSALRAVAISLMRCGSAVGLLCCNLKVDFHSEPHRLRWRPFPLLLTMKAVIYLCQKHSGHGRALASEAGLTRDSLAVWIPGQVSRDEETAKDVHFEQVFNPWKPRISGLLYYRVSMQVILESLSTIM